MHERWKQTYGEWSLLGLLAGLCTILSFLQYRWTGEVSRVETEHLRAGVYGQAQQFSHVFDLALTESCNTLVPHDEKLTDRNREAVHIQHFQKWKPLRPRPYYSRIGIAVNGPDGIELLGQSLTDGHLTPMAWPLEWKNVQDSLKSHGGQLLPGNAAGMLLEYPVYNEDSGNNSPLGQLRESEWMIFELDTNYISKVWLPELASVYLNPIEQPLYDIVIRTMAPPGRVIYSSRPEALKNLAMAVDVPINQGGHGADFFWRLEVRPKPGALEAVVGAARTRNLAVAIFLNGLIFVAGYALVRHTRHSRRLAEAQMNFVANVTHELRTPLTVIRGAAHNLKRGVVHERSQIEQYSSLIMQHAEQLGEMVEQVLALAGARRREAAGLRRPVALEVVLNDAVAATTHDTEAAHCKVQLALPSGLPAIMGDASALRRVFQNLITNAAKHGGDGQWIGITAINDHASRPPMVEIQVADRGPGIPVAEQLEVFKPFFRGSLAQAAQTRGSGLGLSLVKEIIVAHGGTVAVRSNNGRGSIFSVRLPMESVYKTK